MTGRGRARARTLENVASGFMIHEKSFVNPAELMSTPVSHCSLPDTESCNQNVVIYGGRGRGSVAQNLKNGNKKLKLLNCTPEDTESCYTATSKLECDTKKEEEKEEGKNQLKNNYTNNNSFLLGADSNANVIQNKEILSKIPKGNSIVTLLKPRRKKREVKSRDDVFDNENLISQRCQYL